MTWVRLEENFDEHPKILRAGPVAAWLFVRCICWSNRHLTDGFVPENAIKDMHGTRSVKTLVEIGLLEAVQRGYRIHDYLHYQPAKADVIATREAVHEQRVIAGKGRAAQASRISGRFSTTSPAERPAGTPADDQRHTSGTAGTPAGSPPAAAPAERPAAHQRLTSTVPDPVSVPVGTKYDGSYGTDAAASNGRHAETKIEQLRRLEREAINETTRVALRRKIERIEAHDAELARLRDEVAP